MNEGDKVVCGLGTGELVRYDGDDDLWLVRLDDGRSTLQYPQEITVTESAPVADPSWDEDKQTQRWIHLYEVGQALRFIDQLKDRGDEPGEMMYDLLAPLAEEVKHLRAEVARLEEGR